MKIQYKHQKFQADAAKAVVDVFAGQPYLTPTYMIDTGYDWQKFGLSTSDFTGWNNQKIVPQLTDDRILGNIIKIQRNNLLEPSEKLEGKYNITIEMETGVGKTYTYIKTMYELNKHYGWSKFIIVVPSVAIREGVYKSFEMTQDHFAEEYGKKIRFFIYNSSQLTEIDKFAADSSINAMIINSQAFNATGKDARRIFMKLDDFRSRRPIDILAQTNPILIIDEPQSVEGKKTKENLEKFNPMITLRYSATHKADSIYNMVYRLDAMEAYNKQLVKRISVKGITETGTTATNGYVYFQGINLSQADPTATIQFDYKGSSSIRQISKKVSIGFDLYKSSNELEEYKNGYVVKSINGKDDSIEFLNGTKMYAGDVIGRVSEEQLRRIQIRETIISHIERERELFNKGIKVLSLFFIDEVSHYKVYKSGTPQNGIFADMFEEEYKDIISSLELGLEDDEYSKYLKSIDVSDTHAGYFSVDKKGYITNNSTKENKSKRERDKAELDAYDLIMRNKERLLDRNPKNSPVRFIFSHSALREGWDNPNVFQICTLKQSNSEVRKRQEVGRGLRLCVNQLGERMDVNALGNDVHNVNVLTIIASESYDSFARGLQSEIAEAISDRPSAVTADLFKGKVFTDKDGNEAIVDDNTANKLFLFLYKNEYIDDDGILTDKYFEDKKAQCIKVPPQAENSYDDFVAVLNSVYDTNRIKIENARSNNIELRLNKEKLQMKEFKKLWAEINTKSIYTVSFDTEELIRKCISALNDNLKISKIYFRIEQGSMKTIKSKEKLISGEAFVKETTNSSDANSKITANSNVKYDLVGKIVEETELTRKAIVSILQGINQNVFNQFKDNPEEFITKASILINDQKAAIIIEHITYNALEEHYGMEIFTDSTIKGKLDINAIKTNKHLYDHVVYDSSVEKKFAQDLDVDSNVAVYVKLPNGFYISTPLGKYRPDWAIAFYEGTVKHIYFIAETKGSLETLTFNHQSSVESAKIKCAAEHFKAISNDNVVYSVVDSYETLMNMVMK